MTINTKTKDVQKPPNKTVRVKNSSKTKTQRI